METEAFVRSFLINNTQESLTCRVADKSPIVEVNAETYLEIEPLLLDYPMLLEANNLLLYAQVLNFFAAGIVYDLIENPTAFKQKYIDLNAVIQTKPSIAEESSFGPFDVSEITLPKLEDGQFIFYVEDAYNKIPYKVKVPHPLTADWLSLIDYAFLKKPE